MGQLKMLRPSAPVTPRPLPEGYTVSLYRGTEDELTAWLDMCFAGQLLPENPPESGEYRDWFKITVLDYTDLNPAEDIIFILDPAGAPVASICAVKHGAEQGYIHMVAAHPASRGKGIGHAMLAVALEKLEDRGCTYSILTTDDFRLPAIKTYLDAGFRPVLWDDPDSDQRARWDAVIAQLGYEPVEYLDRGVTASIAAYPRAAERNPPMKAPKSPKPPYPPSLFWSGVAISILRSFLWLAVSTILLVLGRTTPWCAAAGLALLVLVVAVAIVRQLIYRQTLLHSDTPELDDWQAAMLSPDWEENVKAMVERAMNDDIQLPEGEEDEDGDEDGDGSDAP